MMYYDLLVPIRISRQNGFYNDTTGQIRKVLGYTARMLQGTPYHYIVLESVEADLASELLQKLRKLLPWASLRLDFSILSEPGDLHFAEGLIFNGHVPTLARSQSGARPFRSDSNHRREEGDLRLLSALAEAETVSGLYDETQDPVTILALELFTTVDFEATYNAQFLTLTSALELLSRPGDRAPACINLIQQMIKELEQVLPTAQAEERQALKDMRSTAAQFWIKQSFRSAIRSVAIRTAQKIGDESPEETGRAAVKLYGKRSKLVHEGKPVSANDVKHIRQLVREVLAVELNQYNHIRERYPAS